MPYLFLRRPGRRASGPRLWLNWRTWRRNGFFSQKHKGTVDSLGGIQLFIKNAEFYPHLIGLTYDLLEDSRIHDAIIGNFFPNLVPRPSLLFLPFRRGERPWLRLVTCLLDFSRFQRNDWREGQESKSLSRLSPPTEPCREWNCNLKLNVAWSAGKTLLFLEKMSTRNLQSTPKMISKSSVPIDLFTVYSEWSPVKRSEISNKIWSWLQYWYHLHPLFSWFYCNFDFIIRLNKPLINWRIEQIQNKPRRYTVRVKIKKTVNSLSRFSSKIRWDTKPQEFREKQTNGLPSMPRSCSRETFLLND